MELPIPPEAIWTMYYCVVLVACSGGSLMLGLFCGILCWRAPKTDGWDLLGCATIVSMTWLACTLVPLYHLVKHLAGDG